MSDVWQPPTVGQPCDRKQREGRSATRPKTWKALGHIRAQSYESSHPPVRTIRARLPPHEEGANTTKARSKTAFDVIVPVTSFSVPAPPSPLGRNPSAFKIGQVWGDAMARMITAVADPPPSPPLERFLHFFAPCLVRAGGRAI